MILVDIYVPSLDKTYDFHVDETVQTEKLIMEIVEMIGNDMKAEKKNRGGKVTSLFYGSGISTGRCSHME